MGGVDDLRSDSDTDDEDNPKEEVPGWAEGNKLRTALLKQCYMGPDVDKIFFQIEDPDRLCLTSKRKGTSSEQAAHAGTQHRNLSTLNEYKCVKNSLIYSLVSLNFMTLSN